MSTQSHTITCNHTQTQLYIVFVVADGGSDLEHYELRTFEEARSLLLQTTLILAVGEAGAGFEHRDLHWGNVLLQPTLQEETVMRLRYAFFEGILHDIFHDDIRGWGLHVYMCIYVYAALPVNHAPSFSRTCFSHQLLSSHKHRGVDVHVPTGGILTTLIDFTLSRLDAEGGDVVYCDLQQDPEIFQGPKGDCQADTYRRMRTATKGDWSRCCPKTNALWLHYLADIMLQEKRFAMQAGEQKLLRGFRYGVMCGVGYRTHLWACTPLSHTGNERSRLRVQMSWYGMICLLALFGWASRSKTIKDHLTRPPFIVTDHLQFFHLLHNLLRNIAIVFLIRRINPIRIC